MRWIALLPLIGSTLVAAQSITLPGVVVVQNSAYETGKRQFISDASIRAPLSKPQVTDQSGRFRLEFSGLANGTPVRLMVSKPGFEMVNAREVQNVILGRTVAVEVVMADAQKLAEAQMRYYRIATDGIAQNYQQKIALLKAETVAMADRLAAFRVEHDAEVNSFVDAINVLTKERDRAQANAAEIAERFATTDLDDASKLFRSAFELFQRGQLDSVLILLDKDRIDAEYASARSAKQEANDRIHQLYESLILKVDVLKATMDQKGALLVMDDMATMLKSDPDAFSVGDAYEFAFQHGSMLRTMARYPEARDELQRGLTMVREHLGQDNLEQVRFLARLASCAIGMDDVDGGIKLLKEGLELMNGHEDDEPRSAIALELVYSNALWLKGDVDSSVVETRKCLAILARHFPPNDPDALTALTDLGRYYRRIGDKSEALKLMEEVRELAGVEGEHLGTARGGMMSNISMVYKDLGMMDQAEVALKAGKVWLTKDLCPEHPFLLIAYHNMAELLEYKGDYVGAIAQLDSGLVVNNGAIPEDHSLMMYYNGLRADILLYMGDYATALDYSERGLDIAKKAFGDAHTETAGLFTVNAQAKTGLGALEEASAAYSAALQIYLAKLPVGNPRLLKAGCRFGGSLVELGNDTAALRVFELYLPQLRLVSDTNDSELMKHEKSLGKALYLHGDMDSARVVLDATVRVKPHQQAEYYLYKIAMDHGREADALEHILKAARLCDSETKDERRKEMLEALRALATRLGRQEVIDEFKE